MHTYTVSTSLSRDNSMPFILNRINDYEKHRLRSILFRAVRCYFIYIAIAFIIRALCLAVYSWVGINPTSITETKSSVKYYLASGGISPKILIKMLFVGPICEELIFRLGLSLNKRSIFLWFGAISILLPFYFFRVDNYYIVALCVSFSLVASIIFFAKVSERACESFRIKNKPTVAWISAILFGLAHTTSFTVIKPVVLPYILCSITPQFFSGCVITYLRMNVSFVSGLIAHIMINSFSLAIMLLLQTV